MQSVVFSIAAVKYSKCYWRQVIKEELKKDPATCDILKSLSKNKGEEET